MLITYLRFIYQHLKSTNKKGISGNDTFSDQITVK